MKKENIYKFLLIGLFALISIAVPVATIISSAQLPENAFSENENRYLEKMPKFNFDTVTDKTFMTKFENLSLIHISRIRLKMRYSAFSAQT